MKAKKAKRGRPIVGSERKEAYLVHLEPSQAHAIRAKYGGPTESLTQAIREMHALLNSAEAKARLAVDGDVFGQVAHMKTVLKRARRAARAHI